MQRSAFAPAAPPRPAAPKPAANPLARSFTPLKLEVQRGAKELVVDEFVDTYFRERPKTIRGPRLDELPLPPPEPPATGAQGEPRPPVDDESGIRALGATRDEIELSIAEHEEDLIALEARLADRDEHIESMQGEMLRLQMELEALRRHRASSRPPHADAGQASGSEAAAPESRQGDAPVAPGPRATRPAPPSRLSATRLVVAAAAVLAAAGIAGSIALRPDDEPAPAAPSAAEPVAPPVTPSTFAPTAKPAAEPAPASPGPAQPSSAAPPASPAAPTQAPTAAAGALPPASDVEEAGLLSFQAHLTVRSDIDAEVVVQGQPVGRTNQKLLVRCGPRNVRIRDERGWRSAGEHVRITCMHAVTVPIPASP